MKFKKQFDKFTPIGEMNNGPILVQPDEVMTLSEMLSRHARGMPLHGRNDGEYFGEDFGYIPEPAEMDLVDLYEYRKQISTRIKELETPIPKPKEEPEEVPTTAGSQSEPQAENGDGN